MKYKVYAVSCPDYDHAPAAIARLLEEMGGMSSFAHPGETLLLKVNLLSGSRPEQAVTVHPAVVEAVAKQVSRSGAAPLIADSPGPSGSYTEGGLRGVYDKCGMTRAANRSGAALNFDVSARRDSYPEGRVLRQKEVITPAAECDGMINLCKMKTHMFMSMTGAVKNHFGLIPGKAKVGFHATLPEKPRFAHMLLDLAGWAAPRLSIMDAVLAMEGDGPGAAGTPRPVGLLLAAESPLALDVVAAEIMGLPAAENPILQAARQRALHPVSMDEIELVGANIEDLRIPDYRFPAHVHINLMDVAGPLSGLAARLGQRLLPPAPQIKKSCIGCGICQRSCPQGAITLSNGKAKVAPAACIRCYCCHELCPHQAVALRKGLFARIFH